MVNINAEEFYSTTIERISATQDLMQKADFMEAYRDLSMITRDMGKYFHKLHDLYGFDTMGEKFFALLSGALLLKSICCYNIGLNEEATCEFALMAAEFSINPTIEQLDALSELSGRDKDSLQYDSLTTLREKEEALMDYVLENAL